MKSINYALTKLRFFNINNWDRWKCISLCFYSSFRACNFDQYFFDVVRNITSNKNYFLESIKRRSKVHEKNMYVNVVQISTKDKSFPKSISQEEFDYGLLTELPRTIATRDFSMSSFKLKSDILLPLTK